MLQVCYKYAKMHTCLTKDLSCSPIFLHIHGAKGGPRGTLGVVVVVRLVLIL